MINLRYHIISLTAVFLALGIGITLGSTFLDRFTVDNLQRQLDSVSDQVRETRSENSDLSRRVDHLEDLDATLGEQLPERLLDGQLSDVPVLVVATRATDEGTVSRVVASLAGSGAEVAGTWWITDRWALDDERQQADLAAALGLSGGTAERLRRSATVRLADILLAAARPATGDDDGGQEGEEGDVDGGAAVEDEDVEDPAEPGTPGDDVDGPIDGDASEPGVVAQLRRAGFVDYEAAAGSEDERVLVPGTDVRIVVVAEDEPGSSAGDFLAGLLAELTSDGMAPVVVAQGSAGDADEPGAADDARTTFVGPLRGDDDLAARLSTVDHIDTAAGLLALVLAVQDLGTGTVGHYGLGPGAGRLLPAPPPPP